MRRPLNSRSRASQDKTTSALEVQRPRHDAVALILLCSCHARVPCKLTAFCMRDCPMPPLNSFIAGAIRSAEQCAHAKGGDRASQCPAGCPVGDLSCAFLSLLRHSHPSMGVRARCRRPRRRTRIRSTRWSSSSKTPARNASARSKRRRTCSESTRMCRRSTPLWSAPVLRLLSCSSPQRNSCTC